MTRPVASRAQSCAIVYLIVYPAQQHDAGIGKENHSKFLIQLARPKRFELLTPRFVVWCSIRAPGAQLFRHRRHLREPGCLATITAAVPQTLRREFRLLDRTLTGH